MAENGTVVIALDGGEHSRATLDWGLKEADLRGADVLLVRCWQEPFEISPWGYYPATGDWGFGEEAQRYLEMEQARAVAERPGRRVAARLVQGPAVPALRQAAAGAQLLVVGACSLRTGDRLGGIASHLAAHAPASVAVVRQQMREAHAPVLVGVDGSATSFVAARDAAREAALRDAPLVVLHARRTVADPYGTRTPPPAAVGPQDPVRAAADALADELRTAHPDLQVDVELVDDDPAHALVERSKDAGLVVVGCRGLDAFRGMLLGSVSHEVLRRAACPVLVAREAS
ncbi:universal stress protein [Cellulomonas dongxiuzhuiae]|uniref:universal stress protein n=1 Tax=Cellulomonas dongxiuzhuiae TaxID=2819979 RepID=UPI001AAE8802|nr:universal stress protein [Cellulomonas dongxiuzhuiae]MBO3087140.1 universal stress protein [Cellulomonas dongxiuzhuiae]